MAAAGPNLIYVQGRKKGEEPGTPASLIKEAKASSGTPESFAYISLARMAPCGHTASCKGSWEGKYLAFPAFPVEAGEEANE